MEQPNNIDHLFQQRLQHAEVPPPDFVWANVERTVKRRKRRFFLWIFTFGVACTAAWAMWQALATDASPNVNPQENQPAKEMYLQEASPVASSDALQSEKPTSGNSIQLIQEAETAKPDYSTEQSKTTTKPRTGLKSAYQPAKKPTRMSKPSEQSVQAEIATVATEQAPQEKQQQEQVSEGVVQLEESASSIASMAMLRDDPDFLPLPNRHPKISPIKFPPIKKKAPKKCYDFHTNRTAWLIDAYAGPSLVHKSLYSGNPEYKEYIQDRLATEKRQFAYNAGLRLSYLFAENFILRTGLQYDHLVEEFEYIDPNFIKYTVDITQQYINGQWTSVVDTVDIQYGSSYLKTYNRFSMLDIPLQAALELRSGITGVSLNLGGSVNLLFQKHGNMLALDGKPVDIEQFGVFRPKLGLSLLGSIQWFIHVTPRTRLFAEPYYKHILDPVTNSTYPVEQSYGIGGVRFGITQIFD